VYDVPRFAVSLLGDWKRMHNREEKITVGKEGVRCEWEFTSELHVGKVFPTTAEVLMVRALRDWPITFAERPPLETESPAVSFVIGHRGTERLPHLLATLRTIAAQKDATIECIVVEQSAKREIEQQLPAWVRYCHTRVATCDVPYNRSWTLNEGARLAKGKVLVLHDNDMLLPERYAAEATARIASGNRFIDLKRFIFYLDQDSTRHFFEVGAWPRRPSMTVVQNLRGGSISVSREAYWEVGGFDEEFVGWGGEDNEFWDRAEAAGGADAFGALPIVHLFHAPQPAKLDRSGAPAVKRYNELRSMDPRRRITRLRERQREARVTGPFGVRGEESEMLEQ
jgi:hypothetical protein